MANKTTLTSYQDRVKARNECVSTLNNIIAGLELCENENQLYNLLYDMGLNKYEYKCDEIYKNGESQAIRGITKIFTLWSRVDENTRQKVVIDVENGVVNVHNIDYEYIVVSEGVSSLLHRMLGRL